ncbi:hypothetical protein E2C01_098425 [Portunus trituberculatus]|uniref:Uncharacterized protein n=1 Tax=Portunus trituberculatus TaxID=210409 RepID=A0A5B7K6Y9_PORTR|nr:hypothetical protein [Portunus trituberculatus]
MSVWTSSFPAQRRALSLAGRER